MNIKTNSKAGDFTLILLLSMLLASNVTAINLEGAVDSIEPANKWSDKAQEKINNSDISIPGNTSEIIDNSADKVEEGNNLSDISTQLSWGEQSIQDIQSEASQVELDSSTKNQITQNINVGTQKLPSNKSERIEVTVDTASKICSSKPSGQDINKIIQEVNGEKLKAKRLENAAAILKENYKMDLSPNKFQSVYRKMQTASTYAPVTGSYLNLVNKSCEVERENSESIKEFYQASAYFGAEVVLIQAGAAYKVSSKSVRLMNSKAGMARIRGYCGNKCYKSALSEAHWAVRNGVTGMKNHLMYESEKLGHKIDSDSSQDFINKNSDRFEDQVEKSRDEAQGTQMTASGPDFISGIMAFLSFR